MTSTEATAAFADTALAAAARTRSYATLDAIRGVAAAVIVLRHTGAYFNPLRFQESYLAVDIFFVLSGFVIANAYGRKLAGGMGFGQFMRIRIIRLYPLYLLGLIVGIASVALNRVFVFEVFNHYTAGTFGLAIVLGLFMLPTFGSWSMFPLNGPSWSLFFEMVANAVYAGVFARLTMAVLLAITGAAAAALVAIVITMPHHNLDYGWTWSGSPVGMARVTYSFFTGVLIHRWLGNRGTPRAAQSLCGSAVAWVLVAVVALLLMAHPAQAQRGLYDVACVLVLFPLVVTAAIRVEPGAGGRRVAAFLGIVSYPVYVLHEPVGMLLRIALQQGLGIDVKSYAPLGGALFLTLLLWLAATIVARFDTPVRQWLTLRFVHPPPRTAK